ncbi:hypothetical protein Y1Q_0013685 [Alligator mississippiensis]|uniref:Uncharacterized protein n=1 Tax=Alligator mississippiensis TaxID=8496 RepID=A0A151P3R6_ALLMI|nr:hypothetical protein Y1Q_0013685 [Alligator mississippiensis]
MCQTSVIPGYCLCICIGHSTLTDRSTEIIGPSGWGASIIQVASPVYVTWTQLQMSAPDELHGRLSTACFSAPSKSCNR